MKTILVVVIILIIAAGGVFAYRRSVDRSTGPSQVVCTMDAKLCPDGSYVGRVGPNCEFARCPGSATGTM